MNLKLKKQQIAASILGKPGKDAGGDGKISIKRDSVKYGGGGGDVEELRIENDRLQTSCMILTQKLKMKEDDNQEEIDKLKGDINQWKEKYKNMKNDNSELNEELEKLRNELKNSAGASAGELKRLKTQVNELQSENV